MSTTQLATNPPRRIGSLDALRGVAATTVVFAHVRAVFFTHHTLLDVTPFRVIWAGQEAVVLFFVLSGFVLSRPYCLNGRVPYARFLIQRFSRIYLPYLASFICCLVLSSLFAGSERDAADALLIGKWPAPTPWHLVLQHVGLVGEFNSDAYNPVIWSLVHEMRFALVFPVFIWALRSMKPSQALLLLCAVSAAAAAGNTFGIDTAIGFKNSYLYSAHFLLFFMIGAVLAKHCDRIGAAFAALSRQRRTGLLLSAAFLYCYSISVSWIATVLGLEALARMATFIADWGVGAASAVLIIFAIYSTRTSRTLNHPLLGYVGRISFSLYLVHVPVLMTLLYLFGEERRLAAVIVGVPMAFLVAAGFHRLIESPSQHLGHLLTRARSATMRSTAI